MLWNQLSDKYSLERTKYLAELAKISEIYKQDDGVSWETARHLARQDMGSIVQGYMDSKDFMDIEDRVSTKIPLIEKPTYGFITDSLLKNIPQALDNIGDVFKDAGSKFK